jgi:hypothetical protein
MSPERRRGGRLSMLERARRYLAATPSAIQGQHGDVRTFGVCCKLIHRFDLTDHDALALLADWNARCRPPWSERDLAVKIANARRYNKESIGRLSQPASQHNDGTG